MTLCSSWESNLSLSEMISSDSWRTKTTKWNVSSLNLRVSAMGKCKLKLSILNHFIWKWAIVLKQRICCVRNNKKKLSFWDMRMMFCWIGWRTERDIRWTHRLSRLLLSEWILWVARSLMKSKSKTNLCELS